MAVPPSIPTCTSIARSSTACSTPPPRAGHLPCRYGLDEQAFAEVQERVRRRLLRAFTYGFCELRGWRERFNAPAGSLQKLDTFGLPPQAFLGVAGMPGLTAWVGLLKIAMPKPRDGGFVSAASGAVGSVVCQIAKLKGHTVIGSAGGAAKCAFVKH